MSKEDGFKTSFVIDVAPEQAWEAVARPSPGEPEDYHLPGFEARCVLLEIDPGRVLRVRKDEEPCKGTEIVVVLEAEGSGTRITVSQSGFGPWLPDVLETFRVVWNLIVADLALYIERRISLKTHLFGAPPPRVSLGIQTRDTLSGLLVTQVDPDSFGARAGLEAGDLLLTLNDVRVLYGMQLADLARLCSPGNELRAVWARKDERMRGNARLSSHLISKTEGPDMTELELIASVPVLNVSDVARSVAFYRDRLGFAPAFEFGPYAGVQRGALELHLDGGSHEFSAGPTCCRFHVRGVDGLYAELEPKGVVKPDEQLATAPHGMRQFSVLDPDGNRITFAEPARS